MLKNIAKYSATACLVSVVVLNSAAIAETIMNKQMVSEVASKVVTTQTTSSTKVAESSLNAQAKPFIPAPAKHETLMKRDVPVEKQVAMKEVKQSETKIIEHELKSSTALNSTDSKLAEKKAKHDVKAVEKKIEAEHKAVAKQETVMKRDMAAEIDAKAFVPMMKTEHEHKEKVESKSMMPAFFADSKWMEDGKNYFKVKAGIAQPMKLGGNTKIDNKPAATYVVGATIGREIIEGVSADLEYTHRAESKASFTYIEGNVLPQETSNWSAKSQAVMANVNVNLTRNSLVTPYIRVGAGLASNRSGVFTRINGNSTQTNYSKTTNAFAWQAGMGMSFVYNATFDTELEYMFVNRGKVKTSDIEYGAAVKPGKAKTGTLKDHVVTFGVKIKF